MVVSWWIVAFFVLYVCLAYATKKLTHFVTMYREIILFSTIQITELDFSAFIDKTVTEVKIYFTGFLLSEWVGVPGVSGRGRSKDIINS